VVFPRVRHGGHRGAALPLPGVTGVDYTSGGLLRVPVRVSTVYRRPVACLVLRLVLSLVPRLVLLLPIVRHGFKTRMSAVHARAGINCIPTAPVAYRLVQEVEIHFLLLLLGLPGVRLGG